MNALIRFILLVSPLLFTLNLLGCAGEVSPINPLNTPPKNTASQILKPQTHLWGYYDVYIDIEKQTVEAVENRQAMFTCNVVNFINKNPAGLGFKINKVSTQPDYVDIDIDVSIRHPFPGLPQYNLSLIHI